MPSSTAQLIQTIVALQDMQTRQKAQKLAEQMAPFQQSTARTNNLAILQGIGSGMTDPNAMSPYAGQLAPPGLDPAAVATLFHGTPPSVSTTQGAATATGYAANPSLAAPAATHSLTGGGAGDLAHQGLMADIYAHAQDNLDQMGPADQSAFAQGVLQKVGTGQSLWDATMDKNMSALSPEEKKRAAEIGARLAPDASTIEQLKLGWAQARIQDRQVTSQSAYQMMEARAALMQASSKLSSQAFSLANETLTHRDALLQKLMSSSATLTKEGVRTTAEQINAYNDQLRKLLPDVYGPQGHVPLMDVPTDGTIGTTGFGQYIQEKFK